MKLTTNRRLTLWLCIGMAFGFALACMVLP